MNWILKNNMWYKKTSFVARCVWKKSDWFWILLFSNFRWNSNSEFNRTVHHHLQLHPPHPHLLVISIIPNIKWDTVDSFSFQKFDDESLSASADTEYWLHQLPMYSRMIAFSALFLRRNPRPPFSTALRFLHRHQLQYRSRVSSQNQGKCAGDMYILSHLNGIPIIKRPW